MTEKNADLYLCLTTVADKDAARSLARLSVERGLAACSQIDGPIESVYVWKGQAETDQEYRVLFKAVGARLAELESAVAEAHPYETPQWVVLEAVRVAENYLKWAEEVSKS